MNWNIHSLYNKGLMYSVEMGNPENIFRGENNKKHQMKAVCKAPLTKTDVGSMDTAFISEGM